MTFPHGQDVDKESKNQTENIVKSIGTVFESYAKRSFFCHQEESRQFHAVIYDPPGPKIAQEG